MSRSPLDEGPTFLSQSELKAKFEHLGMLEFLRATCTSRKIKLSATSIVERRNYTRWHGETFISNTDGTGQATIYWRKTLDGGEEYTVEQFTSQDGRFYASAVLQHPDWPIGIGTSLGA